MMARTDSQFRLRLPADLKALVVASATANHRTINAEINHQLSKAYDHRVLTPAAKRGRPPKLGGPMSDVERSRRYRARKSRERMAIAAEDNMAGGA